MLDSFLDWCLNLLVPYQEWLQLMPLIFLFLFAVCSTIYVYIFTRKETSENNRCKDEVCVTTAKLPSDVVPYMRVPEEGNWVGDGFPRGVLSRHNTLPGVWGKIVVTTGQIVLETLDEDPEETFVLSPGKYGVVAPQQWHRAKPLTKDSAMHIVFHATPNNIPEGVPTSALATRKKTE